MLRIFTILIFLLSCLQVFAADPEAKKDKIEASIKVAYDLVRRHRSVNFHVETLGKIRDAKMGPTLVYVAEIVVQNLDGSPLVRVRIPVQRGEMVHTGEQLAPRILDRIKASSRMPFQIQAKYYEGVFILEKFEESLEMKISQLEAELAKLDDPARVPGRYLGSLVAESMGQLMFGLKELGTVTYERGIFSLVTDFTAKARGEVSLRTVPDIKEDLATYLEALKKELGELKKSNPEAPRVSELDRTVLKVQGLIKHCEVYLKMQSKLFQPEADLIKDEVALIRVHLATLIELSRDRLKLVTDILGQDGNIDAKQMTAALKYIGAASRALSLEGIPDFRIGEVLGLAAELATLTKEFKALGPYTGKNPQDYLKLQAELEKVQAQLHSGVIESETKLQRHNRGGTVINLESAANLRIGLEALTAELNKATKVLSEVNTQVLKARGK